MIENLLQTFQCGWTPFFSGSIVEWIQENVKLPPTYAIPGPVSFDRSNYLKEPLLALADPRVRQVNLMGGVQTGKTLVSECWIPYLIVNEAGTVLKLQQSEHMSRRMSETRMIPLLYNCDSVLALLPDDRHAITKLDLYFPHLNIHVDSAKESSLQSISAKYLLADECFMYKEGFLSQAKQRTKAFPHTSKILFTSQAGVETDEWTKEFNLGVIYEYGWLCPKCNKEQIWQWSKMLADGTRVGIIYDNNETTRPDGKWNYLKAASTARLVCEHCRHELSDDPQTRRYLNNTGRYIVTNPNGDPAIKSYRWPSMASIDISFQSMVMRYLQAKDMLKYQGNASLIEEFYQKDLAIPWKTSFDVSTVNIVTEAYDSSEAWGDYTFMSIDCQNNFTQFYYVIRAWKKDGSSRLLRFGSVPTWFDIRKVQTDNGVKDQCVMVDSGNFATQVYAKCIEYGHIGLLKGKKVWFSWIALQGYDWKDFNHPDGSKKLYSTETRGDPALGKEAQGKTCPHFRWSNYSVKNILVWLRDGKGAKWVTNESNEEYNRQMNSEILTKTVDKKTNRDRLIWVQRTGVPNHYFDCECMQIVGACMVNILGNAQNPQSSAT